MTASFRICRIFRIGGAVGAAILTGVALADYAERPEVLAYQEELVAKHAFDKDWLVRIFADAERSESILNAISRPAERVRPWHEYRRIFVTEKRISRGVDFWRENRKAIDAAHAEYGVAGEIVVAIIGVETDYGRVLGSYRVIDALTTLGFDFPRRAEFFRGQLTEFLLLVREEGKDPLALKGSYAGAMGYGQFIPSSYRTFAVDFDGDGVRDIWSNRTDAIGSVANYFAEHGWRGGGPVAVQVQLGDNAKHDALANQGLDLNLEVGDLAAEGMTGVGDIGAEEKAALFRMETEVGDEYWLGLHDFHVITRYNRSSMYALAVLQLSQELRRRVDAEGA